MSAENTLEVSPFRVPSARWKRGGGEGTQPAVVRSSGAAGVELSANQADIGAAPGGVFSENRGPMSRGQIIFFFQKNSLETGWDCGN